MPFDVTKRTPLSRTMAPLASEYEEPLEVDLDHESLQHYGVQGMRWGVRKSSYSRAGKTFRRTIRKAKKATRNYIGKQNAKKKLQEDKKKAIEASKKRKKSPKDMDDDELKEYHTRVTAQRKLQAAAKNSSLDRVSRETAKKILRESEGISTAELKKTGDKLAERGRQLKELRPSTNAKQGVGWKLAKTALKTFVNTDAVIDAGLNRTVFKAQSANEKTYNQAVKAAKSAGEKYKGKKPDDRKAGFSETSFKKIIKDGKNAKIDAAVDRVWKYKIDKKGGF